MFHAELQKSYVGLTTIKPFLLGQLLFSLKAALWHLLTLCFQHKFCRGQGADPHLPGGGPPAQGHQAPQPRPLRPQRQGGQPHGHRPGHQQALPQLADIPEPRRQCHQGGVWCRGGFKALLLWRKSLIGDPTADLMGSWVVSVLGRGSVPGWLPGPA